MSSPGSMSSNVPAAVMRNNAFLPLWRAIEKCPQQHKAVEKIAKDKECKGKLLLIDHTGRGRSLTMQVTLALFAAIALVIVPFLALTADQVKKIKHAVQTHGLVEAQHIDELCDRYIWETLIPRMYQLAE